MGAKRTNARINLQSPSGFFYLIRTNEHSHDSCILHDVLIAVRRFFCFRGRKAGLLAPGVVFSAYLIIRSATLGPMGCNSF
jgi:hypothetical protein